MYHCSCICLKYLCTQGAGGEGVSRRPPLCVNAPTSRSRFRSFGFCFWCFFLASKLLVLFLLAANSWFCARHVKSFQWVSVFVSRFGSLISCIRATQRRRRSCWVGTVLFENGSHAEIFFIIIWSADSVVISIDMFECTYAYTYTCKHQCMQFWYALVYVTYAFATKIASLTLTVAVPQPTPWPKVQGS